jgi:hypothetical protein
MAHPHFRDSETESEMHRNVEGKAKIGERSMEHASKYLQWVELLLFYHHAEPASTPNVSESHYGAEAIRLSAQGLMTFFLVLGSVW